MRFEGVLPEQRQGISGDARRLGGDDFKIGKIIGRRHRIRGQHHRQIAESCILGQHGEEGVFHTRCKTLTEHDAVDVSRGKMFVRGFDPERAHHSHPLAERYREGRVGGATADQQHRGIARGIGIIKRRKRRRASVEPSHDS